MSIYPFNNVLFFNHDELFVWTCRGHDSNMQWLINQSTMLQKFSKCEVKAWLCWNLIILPPLRFWREITFWRIQTVHNVKDAELCILVNLGLESCSDLLKIKTKNQDSEPLKLTKTTFLNRLNSLKFDFT